MNRIVDTLKTKASINDIDALKKIIKSLWLIRSNEFCHYDKYWMGSQAIDRVPWVIELKDGNRYHSICRHYPEPEMRSFIHLLMKMGKLKPYVIYFSSGKYKLYGFDPKHPYPIE